MSEKSDPFDSLSRIRKAIGSENSDMLLKKIADNSDFINLFIKYLGGKKDYKPPVEEAEEAEEDAPAPRKARKARAATTDKAAPRHFPNGPIWGIHGKPSTPEEREEQLNLKDNSEKRIQRLRNMKFDESDEDEDDDDDGDGDAETSTQRWFRLTENRTPSKNIDELIKIRQTKGLSDKDCRFLDKRIERLQSGKKEKRGNRWARWFGTVSKANLNVAELQKAVQEGKTAHAGKLSKGDIALIQAYLDTMKDAAKTGSHTEKAKDISRRSAQSTRGKGNSGANELRKSQVASA